MATLIPSLSTCASRMTTGERRLAERLERKLDDDYLAKVVINPLAQARHAGTSEADEARLFYVAATRATQTLYITLSGTGAYMGRFPA